MKKNNIIKEKRIEKGLSQERLALISHVGIHIIREIEKKVPQKLVAIKTICNNLGIDINDLFN